MAKLNFSTCSEALFPVEERRREKQIQKLSTAEIVAYPNPAHISVTFETQSESTITNISVSNSYGQTVWAFQKENSVKTASWQVEALPSGMYFYQVRLSDGTAESGKLVVRK